jgi:hypothetical protein
MTGSHVMQEFRQRISKDIYGNHKDGATIKNTLQKQIKTELPS